MRGHSFVKPKEKIVNGIQGNLRGNGKDFSRTCTVLTSL